MMFRDATQDLEIAGRPLAATVTAAALAASAGLAAQAPAETGRGGGPDRGPVASGPGAAAGDARGPARPPGRDTAEVVVFRDVRLFDGRRVRDGVAVLVEGSRISAVGSDVEVPPEARVVDGEGRTLLPGLVDAHVHTFDGQQLRRTLVFGVTTVLDMFTVPETARRLKEEQAAGEARGRADLFSSGFLATAPRGHGTQYGVEVPTLAGPGDAAGWVDARVEEGADYIKIVYDDGSVAGTSFPTLDLRTVERLVEEAHDHDRLAVVHVSSLAAAREVVRVGADVLAHVWMDSVPGRETVSMMRERDVVVIPTLAVIEGVTGGAGEAGLTGDPRIEPYLHPQVTRNLRRDVSYGEGGSASLDAALRSVERLHRAGVPLLAGTDAPNPGTAQGASIHRELELLVEAGLSPREALTAATAAPARVFGLDDRGLVREGRRADLLLVEGDPTSDVTAARRVVGVWKAGVRVDREAYRRRVERARTEAAEGNGGPPAGAESGRVSGFESGEPDARFGGGWRVSTDQMMGGSSRATMQVVEGGADGSSRSLLVEGKIAEGSRFPWAGAMFAAGPSPSSTADLSSFEAVSFRARGDGGRYRLMVFSESLGRRPATRRFRAGDEWRRYTLPLESFGGIDGSGFRSLLFSGGPEAGRFRFRIDDVRFLRSSPAEGGG